MNVSEMMLVRKIAPNLLPALFFLLLLMPIKYREQWAVDLALRQIFHLFMTIVILVVLLQSRVMRRLFHAIGARAAGFVALPHRWLIGGCAGCFFIMACTLSGQLFQHIPHIPDSAAHYVHAKIIASGHLTAPRHPYQDSFPIQYFSVNAYKLFSSYPPGHASILALGMLVGAPWIINPLLGSLFIVALYFLGREIGNRTTGIIAIFLALVSPFVVFMSSEYMSYATSLLLVTLFMLFYLRLLKHQRWHDAVVVGLCLGYIGITRPHCAALVMSFYVAHAAWTCRLHFTRRIKPHLVIAASAAPFFGFFLYYNSITTGSALVTGYESVQGFSKGWVTYLHKKEFPISDLRRALVQSGSLAVDFFCWPVPSFVLMTGLFLFRLQKGFAYLAACLCMTFFLGLIVFLVHDIQIFSARFLYENSGMVLVLSALALQRIPAATRRFRLTRVSLHTWVGALVVMCALFTLYGLSHRTREQYHKYGNHYYFGNADYGKALTQAVKTPALVLVDKFYYVSYTMPPDDEDAVIFAADKKGANRVLMDYYAYRYVYQVFPMKDLLTLPQPEETYLTGGCVSGLSGYYITQLR